MSQELQRNQPCGCVVCICEDLEQCHGCGARSCGTHPIGDIPNPVYAPMTTPSALTRHDYRECPACTANRPRFCEQYYETENAVLIEQVKDAIADNMIPGGVKATYEQLLDMNAALRLTLSQQAQEIEQIRELLGCHRAYITATIQDMLIKAEQQAQEIKRLKQEKNAVVIELYRKLDAKDEHLAAMTAERDAAEQQVAQLDHKNCDLMRRNRILRTRPDLPMTHEEKARYKQLENQVARLREMAEHAVNEEPEMPGEMPLALYEQIKQLDRAGMAEWARIIAWQTKAGVLGRLHALLETEGE